jgi:2-dehydro-3-deoxyphosphogluconate aldolase/(4S)-4-hydroxy-2-oxoglutarate aldolase
MKKTRVLNAIASQKVIAVVRLSKADDVIPVVEAIASGGITVFEISWAMEGAADSIKKLSTHYDSTQEKSPVVIGAGSVLSALDAKKAIKAGAHFVVSPLFKKDIIEEVQKRDTLMISGALTPTEIYRAIESGSDAINVFPADMVSPSYFKSMLEDMPHLRLIPSGGITTENAKTWLRAGAFAVSIGDAIMNKKAITGRHFDTLTQNVAKLIHSLS